MVITKTIGTDMTILNETKRVHEVLGEIRFDNGVGDSKIGTSDRNPFWLARPFGWDSDNIEILISGDLFNPSLDSLERAVQIFRHLDKVEKEGKDLLRPIIMKATSQESNALHYEAALLWIDCQERNSMVVFNCRELPYIKWNLTLSENNEIIDFQETNW